MSHKHFHPGRLIHLLLALACISAQAGERKLVIQPAHIELTGAGARHGLIVLAVTEGTASIDVTASAHLSSTAPDVAALGADGLCRAVSDGVAEIVAQWEGQTARIPISVKNARVSRPPSFRQEIMPILTVSGCNAGGCHGKVAGQNGFRLSLRGYAPEQDFTSLTGELDSRRINFGSPAESLLIQKPLGQVPHEGGIKLTGGSRAHQTLLDWINARAPGPDAAESDAARLEVLPGDRELSVAQSQQLLVLAHYPDGAIHDVTWLCQFFSNDESVLRVSREGLVKSVRPGATSVRAHFQGKVGVVTMTTPFANRVSAEMFSRRNNRVDEPVMRKLQMLRLPPSGLCDDATFLRRAYLDVIGTLPTPEEATAFAADPRTEKRAAMVDALLERQEFVDYWTMQLCDLLQNRKERDHDVRGAKGVRSFQGWLREQVAANRPWDQITRDVLLASGDAVSRPQVGYYIVNVGEKQNIEESDIADSVAMAFLGTRIGCARCHNHPLEKYTQDDYYHFSAYFSKVRMKRLDMGKGNTSLAIGTRDEEEQQKQIADAEKKLAEAEQTVEAKGGDDAKKAVAKVDEAKKRLADLNKQLASARAKMPGVNQPRTGKYMSPQSLDGRAIDWKPGEDPREALVAWITNPANEQFSGAMVNRLWKHFMGVGLVESVDDLRSSNPPSNPELWAVLNHEFVDHHFDLKHVMRLILNSRTYQLSSATSPENEQDRRFYSHFYARRLEAEMLSDAISQATGVPDSFPGYPVGLRAIQLPEPGVNSYFLTLFGRSERVTACACERNGDVTLPQLLHLGNGEDLAKKIHAANGRLASILKESDNGRVTRDLFLATVSRAPTDAEVVAVTQALASGDARDEVFRDLFWALLNSKEFAFNH